VSGQLGESFQQILDALGEVQAQLIGSRQLNELEKAQGYRFILGLHKWVADRTFLGGDSSQPRFVRYTDEFSQWGLFNPDNGYWLADIEGDTDYLISGHRGTTTDICIELRTGIGRLANNVHSRTLAFVDADQLVVEPDGRFEVRIGGAPGGPNYLPRLPDGRVVFVRQSFGNWEQEQPGTFGIEKLGPAQAPRSNTEAMAQRMAEAAGRLTFLARINDSQCTDQRNDFARPNAFVPVPPKTNPSVTGVYPGQQCYGGWFELGEDEALVVSVQPPQCRYLGFSLGDPRWYAPLDFENRQTSLNTAQARSSSDGSFHFVISPADPGVPNWIDCAPGRQGFMTFRCQGLKGEFACPTARLLARARIREALPRDEPVVTNQQRAMILKRRRLAVHRRFF
jgi:hypothetical protein